MGKEEKSYCNEEPGKTFGDGRAPEEVIEMVKRKSGKQREGNNDVKSSSKTNLGKSLLARLREFREKGED